MRLLLSLAVLSFAACSKSPEATPPPSETAPPKADFYISTYTGEDGSKGIYRATLDLTNGTVSLLGLAAEAVNPTWVTLHPNGKFLYASIEDKEGMVAAYAIEKDKSLRFLNQESAKGGGTCHVVVDPSGKHILASNYGTGSVASLPLKADGTVLPATTSIQHATGGTDPAQAKAPHAHAMYFKGPFVYDCDLGTDDIYVHRFDAEKGTLTPNDPPSAKTAPGSGPRHLAFHSNFVYVTNELSNTVTVFANDAEKGTLTEVQTLSTLPADYTGKSYTAEIAVHPNGKFLYVSNRTHDSIAIFSIGSDGKLTTIGQAPSKGSYPRGFSFDPTGHWMVIGGQKSNNLVVYAVDGATGKLTFSSETPGIGAPVCIQFLPL